MEEVILVDQNDHRVGTEEKLEAHKKGLLHRAISVFIYNSKGELLIQQRAADKYHSPELWTNACCSHPRPEEETLTAAHRRLMEEMGLQAHLRSAGTYLYRAEFSNGLIEHEFDHLFVGISDDTPQPTEAEVMNWKYMSHEALRAEIAANPDAFTYWFKAILNDRPDLFQPPVID